MLQGFDSFAPARLVSGLPVYVARVPAAPFCETLILNAAADPTTDLKLARPPPRSPLPFAALPLCRRSRQLHSRIIRIGEHRRLACWFESLAAASHPLQRRPRRTILSHQEEHEAHGAWRSADFRRFRFMNQEKGNQEMGPWIPAFLLS